MIIGGRNMWSIIWGPKWAKTICSPTDTEDLVGGFHCDIVCIRPGMHAGKRTRWRMYFVSSSWSNTNDRVRISTPRGIRVWVCVWLVSCVSLWAFIIARVSVHMRTGTCCARVESNFSRESSEPCWNISTTHPPQGASFPENG